MFSYLVSYAPWLIPVIATAGILGGGWRYLLIVWNRLSAIIIVRMEFYGVLQREAMIYLWENHKCTPVYPRRFFPYFAWLIGDSGTLIAVESLGRTGTIYWKGWRPIWVTTKKSTQQNDVGGSNENEEDDRNVSIVFLRGTFSIEGFIQEICGQYNDFLSTSYKNSKNRVKKFNVSTFSGARGQSQDGRSEEAEEIPFSDDGISRKSMMKRPIGTTWDDLQPTLSHDTRGPFHFLAYPDHVLKFVKNIEYWYQSRQWHKDRRIPWRWGTLLTGPPGSGKSSLIRAVAEHLDLPLLFFDIASMTNTDFITKWNTARSRSPCVVAIEDIDAVFTGRKNVTAGVGDRLMPLTFDCLLNRISGVARADGILLFITSNNATTLDPALCSMDSDCLSRPGRIDTHIVLDGIDEECRTRVANVVLKDDPDYVPIVVKSGEGEQPSQFHSRCTRVAQALYWARHEGRDEQEVIDDLFSYKEDRWTTSAAPAQDETGARMTHKSVETLNPMEIISRDP